MQPISRVRYATRAATFLFALFLFAAPMPALALSQPILASEPPSTPFIEFDKFVLSVADGQAGILRGVYAPNAFALPVVQQPYGNPGFVSSTEGVATQFSIATEVGNVGLLAHNYLSGRDFFKLTLGQDIHLVFGDGRIETYTVTNILRFQALSPYSTRSDFRNLEGGKTITAEELFRQVYRGPRHVTFQTCIEANKNQSWGRLFVIAEPKVPASQVEEQYAMLTLR